jgi:hypothetical protein
LRRRFAWLAVVLCFAGTLSLAACGGGSVKPGANPGPTLFWDEPPAGDQHHLSTVEQGWDAEFWD